MKNLTKASKELSLEEKWAILCRIREIDHTLNIRQKAAEKRQILTEFQCSMRTLQYLEKSYQKQRQNDIKVPDLHPKKFGKVGRKCLLSKKIRNRIIQINFETRGRATYSEFIHKYREKYQQTISRATLFRYFNRLNMRLRRSYIKPTLTKAQKCWRLKFILQKLKKNNRFSKEKNVVHVDEKWFFLTRVKGKVRLQPCGQDFPDETTRHKSHIEKVMFLSALGCPQYKPDGTYFTGKIGIWPIVKEKIAKRTTKKRKSGDIYHENVSCTAKEYLDLMTKEGGVLEAIRDKMGWIDNLRVIIQHDGATPHRGDGNDVLLPQAGREYGWKITFVTQPSNSPDLNKNDLSFFHSLQRDADRLRLQHPTAESLMNQVNVAYWLYNYHTLERIHALPNLSPYTRK